MNLVFTNKLIDRGSNENNHLVAAIKNKAIGPTIIGNGARRPNQNPVPVRSTDPKDIAHQNRVANQNKAAAISQHGGNPIGGALLGLAQPKAGGKFFDLIKNS